MALDMTVQLASDAVGDGGSHDRFRNVVARFSSPRLIAGLGWA